MTEGIYQFSVGKLACIAVKDGGRVIDLKDIQSLYPDIPEQELRPVVENLPEGGTAFCYNTLYIKNVHLLVDTGHGPDAEQHGHTLRRLAEVGITPPEVEIVFISHAHGDHVNGLTYRDGHRVYPNARYVMGKREWQYWMHEATGLDEAYLSNIRRKLDSMEDRLTLVEPNDEIVPGVSSVEAYGHTPGHLALRLDSEGESLLHLVDTLHMQFQITHPDWSPRFDTLKDVSPVTRRRLLQCATDEQMLVYGYHLPFPALGRVTAQEMGFAWQPISPHP